VCFFCVFFSTKLFFFLCFVLKAWKEGEEETQAQVSARSLQGKEIPCGRETGAQEKVGVAWVFRLQSTFLNIILHH
jgi:hypothetical protein